MKNKEKVFTERRNLTTKELVEIGDNIHVCDTALILTDKINGKEHKSFVVVYGSPQDITIMIYEMIKQSENLETIITDAVLMFKMEKAINNIDKKNKDENN